MPWMKSRRHRPDQSHAMRLTKCIECRGVDADHRGDRDRSARREERTSRRYGRHDVSTLKHYRFVLKARGIFPSGLRFYGNRRIGMPRSASYGFGFITSAIRRPPTQSYLERICLVRQTARASAALDNRELCHLADGYLVKAAERIRSGVLS